MEAINLQIAKRLLEIRLAKGWSLDELSSKCGVSRASLSRLEKGEVSASAEMLAKICSAYQISLSRLIIMAEEHFEPHIKASDQVVWQDPKTGFTRRSVSPPASPLSAELLECRLPPGTELKYDKSPGIGVEHHIMLNWGGLSVTVDGNSYKLCPGDSLRFVLQESSQFKSDATLGAGYLLALIN